MLSSIDWLDSLRVFRNSPALSGTIRIAQILSCRHQKQLKFRLKLGVIEFYGIKSSAKDDQRSDQAGVEFSSAAV